MSTKADQILLAYEQGKVVFLELFKLDSKQIKAKLSEMINSDLINDYLLKEGSVQKITLDDEPQKILIHFHDELVISPFGVVFYPEHKKPSITLIHFSNYKII
jgi:hypothetical protein